MMMLTPICAEAVPGNSAAVLRMSAATAKKMRFMLVSLKTDAPLYRVKLNCVQLSQLLT